MQRVPDEPLTPDDRLPPPASTESDSKPSPRAARQKAHTAPLWVLFPSLWESTVKELREIICFLGSVTYLQPQLNCRLQSSRLRDLRGATQRKETMRCKTLGFLGQAHKDKRDFFKKNKKVRRNKIFKSLSLEENTRFITSMNFTIIWTS